MNRILIGGESKTHYFSSQEITKIIEGEIFLDRKTAFIIGYDTGARSGEMVKIEVGDFNFEKKQVLLFDSKKQAYKMVPLSDSTMAAVELYIKTCKIRRRLFPMHPTTLNNWIKDACKREKITAEKKIRWHSWRGTFVRHNRDKGDKWLMQITGDRYDTLLRYYQELTDEDLHKIKRGISI